MVLIKSVVIVVTDCWFKNFCFRISNNKNIPQVVADFYCGLQEKTLILEIIWDLKSGRKYGDEFLGIFLILSGTLLTELMYIYLVLYFILDFEERVSFSYVVVLFPLCSWSNAQNSG